MDVRKLEGSIVALVTPFNEDGSVNFDQLERLLEFHVENGTNAILTLGTTGESATMTDEEDNSVVKFVVDHVAGRVRQVQDVLQRPLVLENVSSYVRSKADEFTEWEFLNALAHLSGCQLLLDVNNVYVSARNHGFDAWTFIRNLPPESIRQLHLAGHMDYGDYVVDTHDHPVCDPVWALYQQTLEHLGPVSTLLERDDHFPPFEELLTELNKARELGASALARRALCA